MSYLLKLVNVNIQLTSQLRLCLRKRQNLSVECSGSVHLLLGILALPFVSSHVILNLQFLRPHERMEMQLAQFILVY